jgi:hypothetical protein
MLRRGRPLLFLITYTMLFFFSKSCFPVFKFKDKKENSKTLKPRRPKAVALRIFLVCSYWTFFFFSKKLNSLMRRVFVTRRKGSLRSKSVMALRGLPLLFQSRTAVTRLFYLLLSLYKNSLGRPGADELEKLSLSETRKKPPVLFRWFLQLAKRRQERREMLRHHNNRLFFHGFLSKEVYEAHVVKITNQLDRLQEGLNTTGLEVKHSQIKGFPAVHLWRHIEMNRNINASVLLPIPHLVLLAQYVDYRFFWKSLLIEQFSYFRYLQR